MWGDGQGMVKRGGRRFGSGDKVTVTVNLETGEVAWLINGQEGQTYKMEKLKNKSINWVPYIEMLRNGDKVEILE